MYIWLFLLALRLHLLFCSALVGEILCGGIRKSLGCSDTFSLRALVAKHVFVMTTWHAVACHRDTLK